MKATHRFRGFSLLEVVIAVAVIGVAMTAVLALLPALTRQMGESAEFLVVQRLPGAVPAELRRLAGEGSWGGLARQMGVAGSGAGLMLVGSRDGAVVQALDGATMPEAEQFFLIELWRFEAAPLAYDAGGDAMLATLGRVSWPYRRPGPGGSGVVTSDLADRSTWMFTTAIRR